MSLLGFDAIGRWALGQNPSNGNVVLVALGASYAETGDAATFSISEAALSTAYTETGNPAFFSIKEAALGANYAETGSAATFSVRQPLSGTAYAETGNSAFFSFNGLTPLFGGSYAVSGNAANVIVLEAESAAGYLFTGFAASLSRDFVNWLPSSDLGAPAWKKVPAVTYVVDSFITTPQGGGPVPPVRTPVTTTVMN